MTGESTWRAEGRRGQAGEGEGPGVERAEEEGRPEAVSRAIVGTTGLEGRAIPEHSEPDHMITFSSQEATHADALSGTQKGMFARALHLPSCRGAPGVNWRGRLHL